MSWDPTGASHYLSQLTEERAIGHLTSFPYMDSHRALIALASIVTDDKSHDGLLGLACAAYGWMPTILRGFVPENFRLDNPIPEIIFTIRTITDNSQARNFLVCMSDDAPINRSWVGTSKLLHFLNPIWFPIWDSRVAEHFSLKWPHQINSKETYLKYFDFVHAEISKNHSWINAVSNKIKNDHGYEPSQVRCLELMLFVRP